MRREKCSICGREVEYRWADVGDSDNPSAREAVAFRCVDSGCPNHHLDQQDYDWAVPL